MSLAFRKNRYTARGRGESPVLVGNHDVLLSPFLSPWSRLLLPGVRWSRQSVSSTMIFSCLPSCLLGNRMVLPGVPENRSVSRHDFLLCLGNRQSLSPIMIFSCLPCSLGARGSRMVRSGVREIVSPCLPSRISSRLRSFSFTACGPRKLPVLVAHYNLLLPSHSLGTIWGCRGSPVLVSHHNYESFPSFRLSPALLICTKGVWGLGKPRSGQI